MSKAISAVIATIMLLMISVSLISVFYVFSSTLATQTTSSGSAQASQLTSQLSICMQIRNIYKNQITLENCGKGVIENKSLVVTMDDIVLGANTNTIAEGNSSIVNVSGLWQIAPGKHSLKISNGAAVAQVLVEVQPNKDGLAGSWNFDEGSGSKANDVSGNGNIGTLLPSGSEPTWVNGKFNKGLQFDGVNDYVSVGSAPNLDFGNKFTITMWVKPASLNPPVGGSYSFAHGSTTAIWSTSWLIFQQNGGLGVSINGDYQYTISGLSTGGWNYVAMTYDGQTARGYLNGVLVVANNIEAGGNIVNENGITIGNDGQSWYDLNGTVDEVRIWNRALAPDETVTIKQLI